MMNVDSIDLGVSVSLARQVELAFEAEIFESCTDASGYCDTDEAEHAVWPMLSEFERYLDVMAVFAEESMRFSP